jgi:hypothetical protein
VAVNPEPTGPESPPVVEVAEWEAPDSRLVGAVSVGGGTTSVGSPDPVSEVSLATRAHPVTRLHHISPPARAYPTARINLAP